MGYSLLTLDVDKRGVATVTLNRPDVHNAFDDKLIGEISQVFTELERNDKVRLAVLAGNGKSFCAGADLNWMKAMQGYSIEENKKDAMRLSEMFSRIGNFSKPLIGIVHGAALGGGSGLVALCDFVLAAEEAKFGFTETRLGLVPGVISPYVIAKIGASYARAYFLSGMMFSATIAKDMGLVHRLVPRDAIAVAHEEIVAEFLKAGPLAARKAKSLVADVVALSKDDEIAALTLHTVEAIANIRVTPEGQEGMNALLKGCKAKWTEGV